MLDPYHGSKRMEDNAHQKNAPEEPSLVLSARDMRAMICESHVETEKEGSRQYGTVALFNIYRIS